MADAYVTEEELLEALDAYERGDADPIAGYIVAMAKRVGPWAAKGRIPDDDAESAAIGQAFKRLPRYRRGRGRLFAFLTATMRNGVRDACRREDSQRRRVNAYAQRETGVEGLDLYSNEKDGSSAE